MKWALAMAWLEFVVPGAIYAVNPLWITQEPAPTQCECLRWACPTDADGGVEPCVCVQVKACPTRRHKPSNM